MIVARAVRDIVLEEEKKVLLQSQKQNLLEEWDQELEIIQQLVEPMHNILLLVM